MERRFAAPRERVWRAWTTPDEIRRWWSGGGKKNTVEECVYEPRPGGRLRLAIRGNESGNLFVVNGTILEVDAPRRIVHTWIWEKGPIPGHPTRVTVEFHDEGGATRVALTHEGFPDDTASEMHRGGWTSQFDGIAAYL
jgi:uncharacterized protein YndB with AHSA1/START domain